jgi:hypothetical protein
VISADKSLEKKTIASKEDLAIFAVGMAPDISFFSWSLFFLCGREVGERAKSSVRKSVVYFTYFLS